MYVISSARTADYLKNIATIGTIAIASTPHVNTFNTFDK